MSFLSLYKIVEQYKSDSVLIELDGGNIVFKVHFQGHPMFPGACMVEIARELISESILKRALKIEKITNLKFLQIISPLECSQIRYIFDIKELEENRIQAKIQVTDSGRSVIFSKISMVLK